MRDFRKPGRDSALAPLDNLDLRARSQRGSLEEFSKNKQDGDPERSRPLPWKPIPPGTPARKCSSAVADRRRHPEVQKTGPQPPAEAASALKRGFEQVEMSPEQDGEMAEAKDGKHKRVCRTPVHGTGASSGLTGVFAAVQLDGFGEGAPQAGSAPVAKNLLSELEDPGKDGGSPHDSSPASSPEDDGDPRRSLSLDSEGSLQDMSVLSNGDREVLRLDDRRKGGSLSSSFEDEGAGGPAVGPCGGTTRAGGTERERSVGGRPLQAGWAMRSPALLKPRNVVVFRSYCSSINRSNMSAGSRVSLGSAEAMDLSTSPSFYSLSANMTPVQRRNPSSSSTLFQVR